MTRALALLAALPLVGCDEPDPFAGPPRPSDETSYAGLTLREARRVGVDLDAARAAATAAWADHDAASALAWAVYGLEAGGPDPDLAGIAAAAWGTWRPRLVAEAPLPQACASAAAFNPKQTAGQGAIVCGSGDDALALQSGGVWGAAAPPRVQAPLASPSGRCAAEVGDAGLTVRCGGALLAQGVAAPTGAIALSDQGDVAVADERSVWWRGASGGIWRLPEAGVRALRFDGAALVLATDAPSLRTYTAHDVPDGLLDASSGAPGTLARSSTRLLHVAPDGRWTLVSADRRRRYGGGTLDFDSAPVATQVARSGRRGAALLDSGTLHLIDLKHQSKRTLSAPPGARGLAFSPDHQRIAVDDARGGAVLWTVAGKRLRTVTFDGGGPASWLGWGRRDELWRVGRSGLQRLDANSGDPLTVAELGEATAIAPLPDAGAALVGRPDGAVALVSVEDGAERWSVKTGLGTLTTVAALRDDGRAWAADVQGRVALVDGETGAVLLRTPPLGRVTELVEDGTGVVLVPGDDGLRLLYAPVLDLDPDLLHARLLATEGVAVRDGAITRAPWRSPRPAL